MAAFDQGVPEKYLDLTFYVCIDSLTNTVTVV